MKEDRLARALGGVDARYVLEAAEEQPRRRRPIRWGVLAACLALAALLTGTALASGVLDPLLTRYLPGAGEEELTGVGSVSGSQLQLRLEAAAADENSCCMVVSLLGLTEEGRRQLERGDIPRECEIYGLLESGERWERGTRSLGRYMDGTVPGKGISHIPDADQTFVVLYEPRGCAMTDIPTVCFAYGGLTLEADTAAHFSPGRALSAEGDEELTEVSFSRLGFAFCPPAEAADWDIRLIRADGTVLTEEEMREIGVSYSVGLGPEERIRVSGNWGCLPAVTLIDMEEYAGLEINGETYRPAE